jgi:predicted ATP-grasp superfamily ATP-dependent carboligase
MHSPPAIILGGLGASLSVTRSLARHGVQVYVLGEAHSLVRASRLPAEFVDCGSGTDIQGRWRAWLADGGVQGATVLPAGDDGVEFISQNRTWLEGLGYVPVEANDDVALGVLDKQRTFELAQLAGIEAPPTKAVSSVADASAVAEQIGFPCAIKPLHSHRFAKHYSVKLFMADDAEELETILAHTTARGLEMLATGVVPGGDDSYCAYYTYIDPDGEPLFHFTKRKLRQWPIHFGLGTYFVTDHNPEVQELGLRFCREVGLRGLANLEFKRDSRDGRLKLIEVNHRFTAVNEIVRRAGIDIAALTYDHLAGRPVHKLPSYRSGVRIWGPIEDLRACRAYRREGELSTLAWLRSLCHRKHQFFFDPRDPGPTLLSFRSKLKRRLPPPESGSRFAQASP